MIRRDTVVLAELVRQKRQTDAAESFALSIEEKDPARINPLDTGQSRLLSHRGSAIMKRKSEEGSTSERHPKLNRLSRRFSTA